MKQLDSAETRVGLLGVVPPPNIQIDCDAFSGTLGLLYQCVRQQKVDLLGVPLAPLCEAYFRYLADQREEDLDGAASALVALAYLVEKKAWMLLPTPEVYDEGSELDEQAAFDPYIGQFGAVIDELASLHLGREQHFFRAAQSEALYEVPFELGEVTAGDLARALERVLRRAVPEKPEVLSRPRRSLADQMALVAKALPSEFLPLEQIVVGELTRVEIVWWFLALLELIRLGQASVRLEGEEVLFAAGGSV